MMPSRASLSPVPPGLLRALSRPLDEPRPGLAPERRRVPRRDPALREGDVAGRRLPGPSARHVPGRSGLDLTVVIHSFTMTVPYPPGAWDMDNVFLQRAAGHVWNAQRNMAALMLRGLAVVNRRTKAARDVAKWRAELVAELGGEPGMTAARLTRSRRGRRSPESPRQSHLVPEPFH